MQTIFEFLLVKMPFFCYNDREVFNHGSPEINHPREMSLRGRKAVVFDVLSRYNIRPNNLIVYTR